MADAPLVFDAERGLLRTDPTLEAMLAGLGRAPGATLRALWRHRGDGAARAAALSSTGAGRLDLRPLDPEGVARIRAASAAGRKVVVVAEQPALAEATAARLDATPLILPRAGRDAALRERFGQSAVATDLPRGRWRARDALRAIRPHQWVKNVLLFLAPVAAHAFDARTFLLALAGIAAFSLAASSIYVVNDLLDLDADRQHATKHRRPFAAGLVPLRIGLVLSLGLGSAALAIGAALGAGFLGSVAVYMALSLAYSFRLKRMRWVDVFTLAALYTLRVVAGAAATGVDATLEMLVFVFPVFLTLGCVKRLTEIAKADGPGRLPGRGYGREDRGDILNMAGLGVVGALVVFALYSVSEQAGGLYPTVWILWLALVPMALWLMRMVALGARGRMDYDPIVFALQDRLGIGLLAMILSLMFWSAGLWAAWFG